ncbi:Nn.00g068520.m01.CDS01 [Neocucurbitaria sp. VM-36]
MLFQKLALFSALAALGATQDIDQGDIPQQCTAVCAEVVSIARRCDDEHERDADELECICQAPNANTLVPSCEACVAQYDQDDSDDDDTTDDNDVYDVLTRCNFTTTAYNTASASSILSSIASSTAPASGSVVVTTSGTVVVTTSVAAASTSVLEQTGAAAPAQTAGAAIGLGALGLALGML